MSYALREALAAFRRAPLLTGVAAAMVGLALFVVGLFWLAAYNLDTALREVEARVEVIAYLLDDATNEEIDLFEQDLSKLPQVLAVRYVSKDSALAKAREDLADVGDVFSDLTVNPLPASLEIRLKPDTRTQEAVEQIAEAASGYEFVEDVAYGRDWTEKLFALRRVAGVTVAVLGIAFAVVSSLIIGAALKIAIFARRDEIYVMRLVGARDGFIRLPFLIEGAVAGLIGGVLAAMLTYATFRVILAFIFTLSWIPTSWVLLGVAAGAVFGVVASGLSLRRHLREV